MRRIAHLSDLHFGRTDEKILAVLLAGCRNCRRTSSSFLATSLNEPARGDVREESGRMSPLELTFRETILFT